MANDIKTIETVFNAGISEELYAIDHIVKNGKEARAPIANALEKINNSFGDVIRIFDDDGNSYTKDKLLTNDALVQYFTLGKGYLKRPPRNYRERERAMTGGAIWSQLEEVSDILDTIIGGKTSGS